MHYRARNSTASWQHQFSRMHIKHNRICCSSVAILLCLLASGIAKTNAVPTDSAGGAVVARGLRALRDVSAVASLMQEEPKDAASAETTVDQPQGQCLFDGVLVPETSVSCEKQVGCRAIQKTGHCCPDYKCDCEKDGKTYLNGDKLVDPETPCTVCYCQGGEILCSSVTCFIRDDCKPKYTAGRCCPEYDNCPVSIFDNNNGVNKTRLPSATPAPAPAPASAKPETSSEQQSPKITIKEITKPTEIRITDENKPLPIHQMLKPSSSSSTSTTTSELSISSTTPAIAAAYSTTTPTAALASTTTTIDEVSSSSSSSESSAPTTLVSVEHNHKAPLPVGGINTESLKLTASVAYPNAGCGSLAAPLVEPLPKGEASVEESVEVSRHSNSAAAAERPIAVFGTQGLQQVDTDSANDPTKVNIKRENLAATEIVPGSSTPAGEEFSSSELIYAQPAVTHNGNLQQTSVDLEPDTAGSDNIYHIILTTAGPRLDGSTDGFVTYKSTTEGVEGASFSVEPSTPLLAVPQVPSSTVAPNNYFENSTPVELDAKPAVPSATKHALLSTTAEPQIGSSTDSSKHSTDSAHHLEEEEAAMPMEANPAYPSLPEDDFSLRDVNFPLSETEDAVESEVKDEQRSISGPYDVLKGTKHFIEHSTVTALEGSGGNMLTDAIAASSSAAPLSFAESTTEGAPGKIALLLNSAEDLSSETTILNGTDFQREKIIKEAEKDTGSGDTLETQSLEALLSSESGSGETVGTEMTPKSGKQREPTTPRPTRRADADLDIDELGNASGDGKSEPVDDPKLDAESLKLNENQDEGVVKQDTAEKGDVLALKTNVAQEQAVEENNADIGRVQRLFLQRFI